MERHSNEYHCRQCGAQWLSESDTTPTGECPKCGAEVSPEPVEPCKEIDPMPADDYPRNVITFFDSAGIRTPKDT